MRLLVVFLAHYTPGESVSAVTYFRSYMNGLFPIVRNYFKIRGIKELYNDAMLYLILVRVHLGQGGKRDK